MWLTLLMPNLVCEFQVKTYYMVDTDEPVLERATGSKIEWKSGKNVTVKARFSPTPQHHLLCLKRPPQSLAGALQLM